MTANRAPGRPSRVVAGLLVAALAAALAGVAGPAVAGAPASAAAHTPRTGAESALPPRAAVTAAASGRLSPSGCTRAGSAVSCELWAKAGTASLLGQPVPVWGYAGSADGPVSAPGPVLVVQQGDTVTVTLHNALTAADLRLPGTPTPAQLAQLSTSLAFPGQPAGRFSDGLGSGVASGVGPGGTASYTFEAARPGTFLYEAGHTMDGARQVALGMAGGLVVLPADTSGAYGTAATAYDDEAVLVLGDLDPDLNLAPATFDMRGFQPRYRTINGNVFPETSPVATDQGHTVLLRYVDAGTVRHAMDILGGQQVRVAQDAQPADHPVPTLVSDLAPGSTMDVLVTMPTGPEAKVTVFEAGGRLDNNGQTEADPTRIAAGGMMTFLDTAAPPPSEDLVGPVPSRITATPNPSTGTSPVVVRADLSDATTGGGTVTYAELVVDDAVTRGVGTGLPLTGTFGTTAVTVTGSIPATAPDCTPDAGGAEPLALNCLSAGRHRIFVRGRDAAGNWGVISDVAFNLPKVGPLTQGGRVDPDPTNGSGGVAVSATGDDSAAHGTVDTGEWFLDDLGAAGSGTPLTANAGGTVAALTGRIPAAALATLADGVHHVYVRSHDSGGVWGPELDIPFDLDTTGPVVVAAAVAPNPTNGKNDDPGNPGNLVVSGLVQDVTSGGGTESRLVAAEGFLDPGASPTPGSGFDLLAVDGAMDSPTEAVYGLIPLSAIGSLTDGSHLVRIRAKDAAGNWGELESAPLTVDRVAPLLGALAVTGTSTGSVALTGTVSEPGLATAEVWVGATDPGAGRATPVQFSVENGRVTLIHAVPAFTVGNRAVHVRVQDLAGNWSAARAITVPVSGGGTGAAGLLGFADNVGAVTVSPQAGLPPGGGNTGVAATVTGGQPAYVSTTSATGVRGLTSTYDLSRNTLRTTLNGVLTLEEARTPTDAPVLALQMRSTAGGNAQVRAVVARSNGSLVTGAWVALSTARHRVAVTWLAGPTTGPVAARGGLRVSVDGATVLASTVDTRGLRIGSLRLGVVAGTTAATTGSLFLDNYTAQGAS